MPEVFVTISGPGAVRILAAMPRSWPTAGGVFHSSDPPVARHLIGTELHTRGAVTAPLEEWSRDPLARRARRCQRRGAKAHRRSSVEGGIVRPDAALAHEAAQPVSTERTWVPEIRGVSTAPRSVLSRHLDRLTVGDGELAPRARQQVARGVPKSAGDLFHGRPFVRDRATRMMSARKSLEHGLDVVHVSLCALTAPQTAVTCPRRRPAARS